MAAVEATMRIEMDMALALEETMTMAREEVDTAIEIETEITEGMLRTAGLELSCSGFCTLVLWYLL